MRRGTAGGALAMTGAKWGELDRFGKRALHLELRTHGQHRDYESLLPSTLYRIASRRRDLIYNFTLMEQI